MDRKPGGAQQTPKKGAEAKRGAGSPQVTGISQRESTLDTEGLNSDRDHMMSSYDKFTDLELTVDDQAEMTEDMTKVIERSDRSIAQLKSIIRSLCDKISNLELTVAEQAETLASITADCGTTARARTTKLEATSLTPPSTPPSARHTKTALQRQLPQGTGMSRADSPSAPTKKYQDFMEKSMQKMTVMDIPGISKTLGGQLKLKGFELAYQVLGHYLESGMCEVSFKNWLKEKSGAGTRTQNACYEAMKDWCDYHHFP